MSRTAVLLLALATPLAAQLPTNNTATAMGRALLAERNGAYADAVVQYTSALDAQPASLPALAGLDRVLPSLGRRAELLPLIERALRTDSANVGILTVAVHTFASLGQGDSARKYAERWSVLQHGDEDAFREWSDAALAIRDIPQARLAIETGRQRLGLHALGVERAELFQRTGDIAAATAEWVAVVHDIPSYRDAAAGLIGQVLAAQRPIVRDVLQKDGSIEARQMLGLLDAEWGEAAEGLALVRGAMPADTSSAIQLLQQLISHLHQHADRNSSIAWAAALEGIADREPGPTGVRHRMDAAQLYANAGDDRNARRLLAVVSASPGAGGTVSTVASTTLIGVLVSEGKSAEAERALTDVRSKLDLDERDLLTRQVAMSFARSGNFAHAEELVANDSSTEALDLRGRIHLYRGDIAGARDLLKEAGPYDDNREQAAERVTLLALMQATDADSLPALGAALLALERGDTVHAVTALAQLAVTMKPAGAAELRLFAGNLALARRDTTGAVTLLRLADLKEVPAASAAARLALAEVSVAQGRVADARTQLEQLIFDYPESAVVPEARRLRDTLHPAGSDY